jgi:SAM-dependent methyltransferase
MALCDDDLDAFAGWEREQWEQRATPYAASLPDLTRGAAPALLTAAGVGAGTRLLDVATGPGVVAALALPLGAAVTAVDQSAAMVGLARAALPEVRVLQAPVEQLPFAPASFDAVTAGFLLNHLARPGAGVAEMTRVLGPGGRLAACVWDLPEANPALGLFGPVAACSGAAAASVPGPDSALLADDGALRGLLHGAGLVEVQVVRVGWQVEVDPGEWFDAVAAATPRTGAALARVSAAERAELRARYVERARADHPGPSGRVVLPASAVVGSGRR